MLAEAAAVLGGEVYSSVAEEVFFLHPFHDRSGLWEIREVDGRVLGFDPTFNHQLWFAAGASRLRGARRDQVLGRVARFLTCCEANLTVLPSGLIHHMVPRLRQVRSTRERIWTRAKMFVWAASILWVRQRMQQAEQANLLKSAGYHAFNLYGFAMLKQQVPDHPFWQAASFRRTVDYLESQEWVAGLERNPYGYPYNPPGFEVPFALAAFGGLSHDALVRTAELWLERQFHHTPFLPSSGCIDGGIPDPVTLTARIYEAMRLPDPLLKELHVPTASPS